MQHGGGRPFAVGPRDMKRGKLLFCAQRELKPGSCDPGGDRSPAAQVVDRIESFRIRIHGDKLKGLASS